MPQFPPPSRTMFDLLPRVRAKDLRRGDLLMHRGEVGTDTGGGRPVLRTEPAPNPRYLRIVQRVWWRYTDDECAVLAYPEQLVSVGPPSWPHSTLTFTYEHIRQAREYVGDREVR